MKSACWFILLCTLSAFTGRAQSVFGIEPGIKYGRIYKHTVNFKPAIERSSYAVDVNFTWQTTGSKEWQRLHYYPWVGINTGYVEYGNTNVLGSAIYLVPNINLPLASSKKLQLYIRAGVGVAYLTKHYDVITNPTNIVIASSINNCTSFGLRARYKLNNRARLYLGSSFTHFSTGDVRLPNLGINVPTVDIGFIYTFKPVDESKFNRDTISLRNRHLLFGAKVGLGFNQIAAPNGPEFPIYISELRVGKLLGRWNKFSLGAQFDFNTSSYYFLRNQQLEPGREKKSSADYSLLLQDEMLFGNYAISLQVAYYLKRGIRTGEPLYQKLGTHYYFMHFGKDKRMGMSWGVYLTTHFFNADYVSTEIGFSF